MKIAVIGSGVAGLACARALKNSGASVSLFDKGRGPGGRLSTRRGETSLGEARWDHGAQFFSVRDEGFQSEVAPLQEHGFVAPWNGKFVSLDGSSDPAPLADERRMVGTPGMNGLIKGLAEDQNVQFGVRIADIERLSNGEWRLMQEGGKSIGQFDAIVCATPAEQAVPLLADAAPVLSDEAAKAKSAPCLATMLAFDKPLPKGFDGAKLRKGPLSWIARNVSKPGREGIETWVLHASPEWSEHHLEDDKEVVAMALLEAFNRATSNSAIPIFSSAHRWRYAQISRAAGSPYGWDNDLKVGTVGDWRLGPRIENAWLSGNALGKRLASELG